MDKVRYEAIIKPLVYDLISSLFGKEAKNKAVLKFRNFRTLRSYIQSSGAKGVDAGSRIAFSSDIVRAQLFTDQSGSNWCNVCCYIVYRSEKYDRQRIGALAAYKKKTYGWQRELIWVDVDYLAQNPSLLVVDQNTALEKEIKQLGLTPAVISTNYNSRLVHIFQPAYSAV